MNFAVVECVWPFGPDLIFVWGGVLSGGGTDVVAVQLTSALVQLGKPTTRTESTPFACCLASKVPLKRRPGAFELPLKKVPLLIAKTPVLAPVVVPQLVCTPAVAKRVTLLPLAETSNSTLPPVVAEPL